MAGSEPGRQLVESWRKAGGNAVVFDVKDSDGVLSIPFQHPLAPARAAAIPDLPEYVRWLHERGVYAIARIVVFRDGALVMAHPELAVRSRQTGSPWRENGLAVWADPSNAEVQDYNLAFARHVAASGVDEIQFDYIRFPAEGDQQDAQFAFLAGHPQWQRRDVITAFAAQAYSTLHPLGVRVSLDIFGITAWQFPKDIAQTGQDAVALAGQCDVLAPMIYPSHFAGMDGYEHPGDAPKHFIAAALDRFRKILRPRGAPRTMVPLRPWLQAFGWETKTYGVDYVLTEMRTAHRHGATGFLLWNVDNKYVEPLAAMMKARARPHRYYRGDELPSHFSR